MIREDLYLINYTLRMERPSKIDPDATIYDYSRMRCPACKTVCPTPPDGYTEICENCGLRMIVHGNCLTCEKE